MAECTGTLTADIDSILTRGLEGINYRFEVEGKQLVLNVSETRAPQQGVVWTGDETNEWNYQASNFSFGGESTPFVTGDAVVFNDESANRNVNVSDNVVASGVTFDFDNGTYTLTGEGGINGNGGLTKNGQGELQLKVAGSNYTGPTVVNEGTLTINNLADGGKSSSIGASSAEEGNLQLNGGTLKVEGTNMATDHIVTLSDTSTINIASASATISLKGLVKGDGYLVKDGPGQLNFIYGGENPFAGLIVKQGKVASGSWNTTFGKVGSPMVLAGGTVDLLDVNNSSTRPVFDYDVTVVEGTNNTVMGTTRGDINGKFKGKGNLTIESNGQRNDIGADFSQFEGTLTAQGENFRLQDNVTDMAKTKLVLDAGAVVNHYSDNGGNQRAVTTKIGSVASTATDCTLGHSQDSYEVGYNNESTTYMGMLKAKTVTKYGTGTWTLSNEGSTSNIVVEEGAIDLNNNPFGFMPTAITTGNFTVNDGGRLVGMGGVNTLVVNKGGTVAAGNDYMYSTLKATGTVRFAEGSTLKVRVGLNSLDMADNDKYNFAGATSHYGDTILVEVAQERLLAAGEEIQIFTGTGEQSGTFNIKTVSPGQDIVWDSSELLSKGVLRVSYNAAIENVQTDAQKVDVYSVDGIKLRGNVNRDSALDGLAPGVYVVDGEKLIKE